MTEKKTKSWKIEIDVNAEMEVLRGLDPFDFKLYFLLRSHMDNDTKTVGQVYRLRRDTLLFDMGIERIRGSNREIPNYTIGDLKAAFIRLEKRGLLKRQSKDMQLIFELPNAITKKPYPNYERPLNDRFERPNERPINDELTDCKTKEKNQMNDAMSFPTKTVMSDPYLEVYNNINNTDHNITVIIEENKKNTDVIVENLEEDFKNYFLEKNGWNFHMVQNALTIAMMKRWVKDGVTLADVEECHARAFETLKGRLPSSMSYYDKVMISILQNKKDRADGIHQTTSSGQKLSANASYHSVSSKISEYINSLPTDGRPGLSDDEGLLQIQVD